MDRTERLADWLVRWEEATEEGRGPLLEDLCREEPELLPEFRGLLRRLGPLNALLAKDGLGDASAEELLGRIDAGRYRPVGFHARGGLGLVFAAEDTELRRTVALKAMQTLAALDADSRRRFLLEAEITAKLEHPGVVPVYGRGLSPRGQPYYAMRFVCGRTLGEALEQHHGPSRSASAAGAAERNVEFLRLLRAFIGVCETIAYAHSRGVIHRDLKPDNIMLGPYGEALVVDWGLAKFIGHSAHEGNDSSGGEPLLLDGAGPDRSVQGRAKGTWSYMSPEQARGEWEGVGPASDVYSLGATLYVLLTGKKPYEAPSAPELAERVKAGDFLPPHRRIPAVPRALDAICVKAMAYRPEDRYRDPRALAGDLERWLADEPVSAWREPLAVRARRWLRRHRTWVVAAAVALVVTAVASTGLAVQARHNAEAERLKNEKLRQAYADLKDSKARVENNYALARQATRGLADYALGGVGVRQLDLVAVPDDIAEREQTEKGLEEARQAFQALLQDHPDDFETQADLADICQGLGVVLAKRGRLDQARLALAEARQGFDRLRQSFPANSRIRLGLALVSFTEGRVHLFPEDFKRTGLPSEREEQWNNDKAKRAEPLIEQARALLDELVTENPDNQEFRYALAGVWRQLGAIALIRGQPQDAIPWLEKSCSSLDEVARRSSHVLAYREDCDNAHDFLGSAYYDLAGRRAREGHVEEALALSEKVEALWGPLMRKPAPTEGFFRNHYYKHLDLWGRLLNDQAVGFWKKKQTSELLRLFENNLPVWEEIGSRQPKEKEVHNRLNWLRVGLAETTKDRAVELNPENVEELREARRILRLGLEALDSLPTNLRATPNVSKLYTELRQRLDTLPDRDH